MYFRVDYKKNKHLICKGKIFYFDTITTYKNPYRYEIFNVNDFTEVDTVADTSMLI